MNSASMLYLAVDAAVKAALILLIAAGLTHLMRRGSAAMRHLVWTASAAAALSIPVASPLLPAHQISLAPPHAVTMLQRSGPLAFQARNIAESAGESFVPPALNAPPSVVGAHGGTGPLGVPEASRSSLVLPRLVLDGWLAGAMLIGVYRLIGLAAGRLLRRGAQRIESGELFDALQLARRRIGVRRLVTLHVGPRIRMPMTRGTIRPELLFPPAALHWPPQQVRSAMLHELAHVKRMDCAAQLFASWACAVYWFNPLAWLAAHRIRVERENACDDLVLRQGQPPDQYAEHLVAVAQALGAVRPQSTGAIAMARSSGLRKRVTRILDGRIDRRTLSSRAASACVFIALLVAMPLASFHVARGGPATAPSAAPPSATLSESSSVPPLLRDMKIDMDGFGFDDALVFLRESAGVKIRVDWVNIKCTGVGPETPIVLHTTLGPLGEQLNKLLIVAAHGDSLGYAVDQGVIIITTRELAERLNRRPVRPPAAAPPPATAPAGAAETGSIQGGQPLPTRTVRVIALDNATGKPLAGANVDYEDIPESGRVKTDARGQVSLVVRNGMDPLISVWDPGYINQRQRWRPESGSGSPPPDEYVFRLDPYSPIGGKVVDDEGKPVAGANVEIYINGKKEARGVFDIEWPWINRAVVTGADGTWRFDRVPPDAESIKVAAWDYRHLDGDYFFLKPYTPVSALRDKTAVLTLPRGVAVSGRVLDPFTGNPIPNATISFGPDPAASNKIPPLTAGADGKFSIGVRSGARLFMTVSAQGYRPEIHNEVVGEKPVTLEFDLSPINFIK